MYDLELKHNSQLQVLYLNPLGNFEFSLAIPGYDHSNFVKFKLEHEDDFELCSDLSQNNYLDAVGLGKTNDKGEQDDTKPEVGDHSSLLQTAQFRFVKQKKLLLQLCSQF